MGMQMHHEHPTKGWRMAVFSALFLDRNRIQPPLAYGVGCGCERGGWPPRFSLSFSLKLSCFQRKTVVVIQLTGDFEDMTRLKQPFIRSTLIRR
jgi:hypothetical protein